MEKIKEKFVSEGFEGFVSVRELKSDFRNAGVPKEEGVYLVLRLANTEPVFLQKGTGGYFRWVL